MRTWSLGVCVAAALSGCGSYGDPNPDLPSSPTGNDPAFSIHGLAPWYLIASTTQPGSNELKITITAPSDADVVDAYVDGLTPIRMTEHADGFSLEISIENVPAGAHDILFAANTSHSAFAKATFYRSAPYYVLVSTDYDFSDPGNAALGYMDKLHVDHPGMIITHFWAPYTYTDDASVSLEREGELDAWIKHQRDTYGDEIGLHIHPYCNFVVAAGVTCITDQSTVYTEDTSGYTIKLSAYGTQPMGTLLQYAAMLFRDHGLGTPKTFRAGGWTADINTLHALDANGYLADSSALNWMRIEEWYRYELYKWTMTHWSSIDDTSQPYYPSNSDPQVSQPGSNMALLEVPDNGVMIDYVSLAEMNGIFDANFDGTPLGQARTLMMGFHPAMQFSQLEYETVDGFLKYADQHLASQGLGPVVYISLSDVTKAFPAP